MDSTHSSAVLSAGTLVPIVKWLATWPIHSPSDETVTAIVALLIASPPAIQAFLNWVKPSKEVPK